LSEPPVESDGTTLAAITAIGHDSAAGSGDWLTRAEVAVLLGVSIASVRRLQGRDLHPQRSEQGFYLFDPGEVESVRSRRPPAPEPRECHDAGELAAEAFKLFRDGVDQRDVLIALKRSPQEIEGLYAAWERMGGAHFVSEKVYDQLRRMTHLRLLAPEVLQALEDDDPVALQKHVGRALKARRANRPDHPDEETAG
jgi:predicted transcriptional regulator